MPKPKVRHRKRDMSFVPASLDVPALAHYLSITNNHAEELMRDGIIPSRIEGSRRVVTREDADVWNAKRAEIESLRRTSPVLTDKQTQAMMSDAENTEDGYGMDTEEDE
jgi:hypothetical protein